MSQQSQEQPFRFGEEIFQRRNPPPDLLVMFEAYDADDSRFAFVRVFNETRRVPVSSLRRAVPAYG
jgi:hypothetical protein